ncbi:MAG: biotin--[acetyl-CoA-carboxylase] ligase [Rhodocyclaceae bacterium]|nr:biotin--[acetyl-CoA-carboxylase] ligase [Rhodocyclaceae bacterium]MBX3667896.1 biotin--[acetyl-CoA-carboxylase] ligase [Rhodocyclaceae bacterium]
MRWLPACGSTNSVLMELPQPALAAPATVLLADVQTAGRGRRGRAWLSQPGAGLTFSVRRSFDTPSLAGLAGLSLVVGLAVAEALEGLGVAKIGLKWPNDVEADGRKLGGVLVELGSTRDAVWAVIGIGINLALPAALLAEIDAPATDLASLLGSAPPREAVLAAVLVELAPRLAEFEHKGFAPFTGPWQRRNVHGGREVRILDGPQVLQEGLCLGVASDGALLLQDASGVHAVIAGDVSLRAAGA